MSKAFLFIALALIVACATAAQFTAVLSGAIPDECEDLIYAAAGSNFVVGSWADQAAWAADDKNADCNTAASTAPATITFVKRDDIAAACFTATKPGAAPACGIATGDACAAATEFCATDNQCVASKCEAQARYVWNFDAVIAAADVPAAVTKVIEALPSAADKDVFPCKDKAPTVKVVNDQTTSAGNGKWWLVSFTDLDAACQAVLLTAKPTPTNVQAATCETCAPWTTRFDTPNNYSTCPCKDADVVISQSRWKLVEGAKLGAAKDFYKTSDCLVAVNFVVGENSEFVLQTATKTSEECQKADPDADKKAEEWKKIATAVTTDTEIYKVTALAADCVSGKTIKCATDEKCASLRCAKGAACKTAADAPVVCAGKCVAAKEGDADGKCNSASVVGYVVAVVAVIAAFVF